MEIEEKSGVSCRGVFTVVVAQLLKIRCLVLCLCFLLLMLHYGGPGGSGSGGCFVNLRKCTLYLHARPEQREYLLGSWCKTKDKETGNQ